MHTLLSVASSLADVVQLAAEVPDPGSGEAPPNAGGFLEIMRWAKWIGLGVCVLGLIGAGAAMGFQNRHGGEGAQHAGRVGWVLAGVMVIGGSVGLVGAVLSA